MFIVAALYAGITVLVTGLVYKRWDFPHRVFWVYFFGLVVDGALFVFRGFKKSSGGSNASGFTSEGYTSGALDAETPDYDPASEKSREAYTDL